MDTWEGPEGVRLIEVSLYLHLNKQLFDTWENFCIVTGGWGIWKFLKPYSVGQLTI